MSKTYLLFKRPDLMLLLDKYKITIPIKENGHYHGYAIKWANEEKAPYDNPKYKELANRLQPGWEEITKEELEKILEDLEKVISLRKKEKLEEPNQANLNLFVNLTKTFLSSIVIISTLITKLGLRGPNLSKMEKDKEKTNLFSFELVQNFLIHSNTLRQLVSHITRVTGATEEQKDKITELFLLTTYLFALFFASRGDEVKLERLFDTLKPELLKCIEKSAAILEENLHSNSISKDQNRIITLFLQKAQLTLEKETYKELIRIIHDTVNLLGMTDSDIEKEFKKIEQTVKELHYTFTIGLDDKTEKEAIIHQPF